LTKKTRKVPGLLEKEGRTRTASFAQQLEGKDSVNWFT